jgi:hypothetical protein
MTFFIYARDGAGLVVLRRDSEEAAQRRAAELKDMGWFDIDITEEDDAGSESALRKAWIPVRVKKTRQGKRL